LLAGAYLRHHPVPLYDGNDLDLGIQDVFQSYVDSLYIQYVFEIVLYV
jgi:hypothetical protein